MDAIAPLLLLFSLFGGFSLLRASYYLHYRSEGKEWERNLFEAAALGVFLLLAVELFAIPFLNKYYPSINALWQNIRKGVPVPHIGALVLSMALGILVGSAWNLRISRDEAVRAAIEDYGGELLILLHSAAESGNPVSLTMNNRKVYVGFVESTPTLRYPHTKIIPTMSGYRNEATLSMKLDTEYWSVYDGLSKRRKKGEYVRELEDFGIVLPIDQICSANIFDNDIYATYFLKEKKATKNRATDKLS